MRLSTEYSEARSTKVGDMGHPNTKFEDKEELAKETKRQEAVARRMWRLESHIQGEKSQSAVPKAK